MALVSSGGGAGACAGAGAWTCGGSEVAEEAAESIRAKYAAAHPDLADRAHVVITRVGSGARSA